MIRLITSDVIVEGLLYVDDTDPAGNPYITTITAKLDRGYHTLNFEFDQREVKYDYEALTLTNNQFIDMYHFFNQIIKIRDVEFTMVSFIVQSAGFDAQAYKVHGLFPHNMSCKPAEIVLVGDDR